MPSNAYRAGGKKNMCIALEHAPTNTLASGTHQGFEWTIIHNRGGVRCGYVRIPGAHPWFEKDCSDIEAEVHGGLTFAKHGKACETHGAKDEWWIGFDCGHGGDAPDKTLPRTRPYHDPFPFEHAVVRDNAYVQAECESLCEQAAKALVPAA
jgi:hypothetical protein